MPTKQSARVYTDVPGDPVKSFFVDMLTRDISLSDSILDLLDNAVDGIQRSKKGSSKPKQPYEGYWAKIRYDKDRFSISDNCGGIPWGLHEYAFRMGKSPKDLSDTNLPTVGTYGIGMKRALFKLGRHSVIRTQHGDESYQVEIDPAWLKNEDSWKIPVKPLASKLERNGTEIQIEQLTDGAKALFGDEKTLFDKEFRGKIATHYAFIMNKGFKIYVNGEPIDARPTDLRFDTSSKRQAIRPFVYETQIDGVDIFLAVGFTHSIPSVEEAEEEQVQSKYSSMDAGWTIICNDRAVVYCDRTELTGWGEAGVPKYHNQFIAISGIVEFKSNDARKLPTTTTKRGIEASSLVYLQVKNKMREGMRMFTDFTNKWKGAERVQQAKQMIKAAKPLNLEQIRAQKIQMTTVSKGPGGKQYKPSLPMPKQEYTEARISFVRPVDHVTELAEYLFEDAETRASAVGERCFDLMLKKARKA